MYADCGFDYGKIQLYAGNYDFWYESSQLLIPPDERGEQEERRKRSKSCRSSSPGSAPNASKSKQATSRKRALEKIQLDEIKPSSRKYPYIDFRPNREIGNEVLTVEGLSKAIDGEKILDNISFTLGDMTTRSHSWAANELAKTVLFQDPESARWSRMRVLNNGASLHPRAYFPKDFGGEFDSDYNITEWLTQLFGRKGRHLRPRLPWPYALLRRGRREEAESALRR